MLSFDQRERACHDTAVVETQRLTAEQHQRDIYEAHRHRVFSVSYYMTANELEAEDILTDTFVQAFALAPAPSADGVDRALLQELEQRFSLAPAAPATAENGSLSRASVRRTDLEEAVGTLPPRERLVFLLRDVEGYASPKVAGLLGSDEADVCRTLVSARIRMRNALGSLRAREAEASTDSEAEELGVLTAQA